nr:nucleotide modification associated domain-containing protein [Clostridium mobile]
MDKASKHMEICTELNELYKRKNHDYGDSFGKTYEEYGAVMAAIRLEDKLQRFRRLIKAESKVKDESIRDTLIDLANYAIMTIIEMDK